MNRMTRIRNRLRRAWSRWSPTQVLEAWTYEGWEMDGYRPNRKGRFAHFVLNRLCTVHCFLRCWFGHAAEDELACYPWWQRPLYRAKAALCIVLGWRYRDGGYAAGVTVTWWDGEMSGYYEPEWEDSNIVVAEGWKKWWVQIHVRGAW